MSSPSIIRYKHTKLPCYIHIHHLGLDRYYPGRVPAHRLGPASLPRPRGHRRLHRRGRTHPHPDHRLRYRRRRHRPRNHPHRQPHPRQSGFSWQGSAGEGDP